MNTSVHVPFGIETHFAGEISIAAVRRKRGRIFAFVLIWICLPLLGLWSLPVLAIQPVTFAPQATFAVGRNPFSVATADFNRDGNPDLVTANALDFNVSVRLGDGGGSFGAQTLFRLGGAFSHSVAIADFNGDGNSDLVSANSRTDNVSVLLGDGSGGFGDPTLFAVGLGSQPESVATADFNGDGNTDLATAISGFANVSVLLGDGHGGFGPQTLVYVGENPVSVTTTDFNHDGNIDLVTANPKSNTVSVVLADGHGGFRPPRFYGGGDPPFYVATADFNRDGNPDVVTANANSNSVMVMLGDGSGHLVSATQLAAGNAPKSVATADFNDDGNPDVVAANFGSNNVSVLLGDGSGGFGAQTTFAVGNAPQSVATTDFNGDGKTDLVAANFNSNNVSVLLNTTVFLNITPPPLFTSLPDINNDGSPEIAAVRYDLGLQKTKVQVKSAKTGVLVKQFNFNGQFVPKFLRAVPDLNSNGAVELAVLGIRNSDQAVQVEIRDSRSGVKLSAVPFPATLPPIGLTLVRDSRCSQNRCLVVLQQNSTVLRAQIKDVLTGAQIRNIGFDPGYKGRTLIVIKSLNGNQSPELALLEENKITNGADKVEIRDSKTGRLIRNIGYDPGKQVRQLRTLPDLNDNGDVELVTLLPNDAQIVLVDAKTGLELNTINTTLAKPYFLGRVNDKTSGVRLALLGKRVMDGQILAEVYDSLTGAVVRTIVFLQIGTTVRFGSIADINGNGTSDLRRVIKLRGAPKTMVEIRDGATGELINTINF